MLVMTLKNLFCNDSCTELTTRVLNNSNLNSLSKSFRFTLERNGGLSFLNQWPLWLLIHSILYTTEMIEFWLLIGAKIDFQHCEWEQCSGSRGTTGDSCILQDEVTSALPVSSGSNLTELSCLQAFRAPEWWAGDEELPASLPAQVRMRSCLPACTPSSFPQQLPITLWAHFQHHPFWSHRPLLWSPCKWN